MMPKIAGRLFPTLSLVGLVTFCSLSRADEFTFKDGRKISGTVVKKNGDTLVVELSPGNMLLLNQQELKVHQQNAKGEAAYAEALKTASDTIDSHLLMASLARKHLLLDHEKAHYERVLDLDSEHATARSALGFVKHEGRWIEREEQMVGGQGKIRAGGSYRFPEYVAMQEAQEKFNAARGQLTNEIRRALKDLNNPRNSAKGQAVLDGLEGPLASAAIAALLYPRVGALGKTNVPAATKALFIPILERLGDGEAMRILVLMCLELDRSPDYSTVRQQALSVLKKMAPELAFREFSAALNSRNTDTINLAGELLQELGDERAILSLIDRLIVLVPREYGGGPQTQAGMIGDGSVGFTKAPPKTVRNEPQEVPGVLGALVSITGQNFRYDKGQWLEWYDREYVAFTGDLRRDP